MALFVVGIVMSCVVVAVYSVHADVEKEDERERDRDRDREREREREREESVLEGGEGSRQLLLR